MKEDNTNPSKKEEIEKQSRVLQTLNYLEGIQKELFIDEAGSAYISYKDGRDFLVSHPIESTQFVSFLQSEMFHQFKKTLKTDAIKEIQQILNVKAASSENSPARRLYRRVGKTGNAIYYDLGDGAIEIDGSGWRKVKLHEQIFRFHSQVSLKQVHPAEGGALDVIFKNINVKSTLDQLLIKIFIVAAFIPDLLTRSW